MLKVQLRQYNTEEEQDKQCTLKITNHSQSWESPQNSEQPEPQGEIEKK